MHGAGDAGADDWLGDVGEIDWLSNEGEDAVHDAASPARGSHTRDSADGASDPSRVAGDPTAIAVDGELSTAGHRSRRFDVIRRRRLVGLTVLALIVGSAIVVPLLALNGGRNAVAPAQTAAVPGTPTTTVAGQPATSPQLPAIAGATLSVTLPAGGSLRRGDRGTAVEQLQKVLVALEYKPGKPDGVFGSNTEAAVVAFQTENDLTPDGIVGTKTARTLNSLVAGRTATQ